MLYNDVLGREVMQTIQISEEDLLRYYPTTPGVHRARTRYRSARSWCSIEKASYRACATTPRAHSSPGCAPVKSMEQVTADAKAAVESSRVIELGSVVVNDLTRRSSTAWRRSRPASSASRSPGRGGAHIVEMLDATFASPAVQRDQGTSRSVGTAAPIPSSSCRATWKGSSARLSSTPNRRRKRQFRRAAPAGRVARLPRPTAGRPAIPPGS